MTPKVSQRESSRAGALSYTHFGEGQVELPLSLSGNWGSVPSSKVRRPRDGAPFAWAHTYTAFSLSFAKAALRQLGATSASSVLDPFLGSGTTMLAAAMCGSSATGIDISPFSALLSRGRMAIDVDVGRVRSYLKISVGRQRAPANKRAVLRASDMVYAQAVVDRMCDRRGLSPSGFFSTLLGDDVGTFDSEVVSLLSLVIGAKSCSNLERGSNPIWYRDSAATSRRTRRISLREAAIGWSNAISNDLRTSAPLFRRGQRILNKDISKLGKLGAKFDICLTSPPYLNRLDYVVAHLPELSLLQLVTPVSLEELRGNMIGTTKMVRKGTDVVPAEWGAACLQTLRSVAEHPSYASLRYYYHTYYQYFERLYGSLKTLRMLMRSDGKGLIVLQDSYYKDVKIPTPLVCAEMLRSLSFNASIVRTASVRTHMGRMSPVQTAYAPGKTLEESLVYFN